MGKRPAVPALMLLVLVLSAPGAHAQPSSPRVAFGEDTATSIVVVWEAPRETRTHRLEWGTTPALGNETRATQRDLGELQVWPVYARLENLMPDTRYYYQIRMGEQRGPLHHFQTGPAQPREFSFLAWGDQSSPGAPEADGDAPQRVTSLAASLESDFVLVMGDLAYAKNEQHWSQYVAQIEPVAARRAFMTVPGNHDLDYGPLPYRTRFRMPTPNEDERWYSFRYGNAVFVGLDTESFCKSGSGISGGAPYGVTECPLGMDEAQTVFARDTLRQAHEDESVEWTIVFHHYGVYSQGRHGSNQLLRTHWEPLYNEYGVDLVLQAHDHLYVRSHPMRGGQRVDGGVTYVTVGTGGAELYRHGQSPAWEAAYVESTHGLLRVTVGATELRGSFLSVDGDELDTFSVQKTDGGTSVPTPEQRPEATPAPAVGLWAGIGLVSLAWWIRRARRP